MSKCTKCYKNDNRSWRKIWSSAASSTRGRIGRGERESVCHIFTNSNSENTRERINALLKAKNGFELAEYDLNQRGIGSLTSGKQWGMSDIAMEAIKNIKLVEIAKKKQKN